MIPIIDLFASIQGEGKYMGVPSIFIRVSGCNLRCMFKGSICDTPYSSFKPEKASFSIEDVKKMINDNPKINHIVITGGEPLMYGKKLEQFIEDIYEDRMVITIETNGTFKPLNPLNPRAKVSLYSVSPKLSTSEPEVGRFSEETGISKFDAVNICKKHAEERINLEALYDIISRSHDYQMKFVYSGKECVDEIKMLYNRLAAFAEKKGCHDYRFFNYNHPNKNTMLMPEGITNEQLNNTRVEAGDVCIKEGWTYTDRLHIIMYGDKRGF